MTLEQVRQELASISKNPVPQGSVVISSKKKFPEEDPRVTALKQEIFDYYNGKTPAKIDGAYGEVVTPTADTTGIIKKITADKDGTKVELFGCAYPYKGMPMVEFIERIAVIKRVFISTARLITKFPFNIIFALAFLLFKKRLMKYTICWAGEIYRSLVEFKKPTLSSFNKCCQEIIRAGIKVNDWNGDKRNDVKRNINRMFNLAALIIEFDNAYRIRFQDIMENVNKNNLMDDPKWEIKRLASMYMEREGIGNKYRPIFKIFNFLMFINPSFVNIVKKFLLELDLEKVKPDEADTYFALLRKGYNVKGLPLEERVIMKQQWDVLKGNVMLPPTLKAPNDKQLQPIQPTQPIKVELGKISFSDRLKFLLKGKLNVKRQDNGNS